MSILRCLGGRLAWMWSYKDQTFDPGHVVTSWGNNGTFVGNNVGTCSLFLSENELFA